MVNFSRLLLLWTLHLAAVPAAWVFCESQSLALSELLADPALRFFWDPYREVALLTKGGQSLSLKPGLDQAVLNGQKIVSVPPIFLRSGAWELTTEIARRWQELLSQTSTVPERRTEDDGWRIGVLLIDPGHGGSDPGSQASHTLPDGKINLVEKELTLKIAHQLEKKLLEGFPDRKIILTRQGDTYPTLEQRVQIAHDQKPGPRETIVFISLHFNASLNAAAKGFEIWHIPRDYDRDVTPSRLFPEIRSEAVGVINLLVNDEFKKESRALAESISVALDAELGEMTENRGLKEKPWFVVRMAKMPAILVELGFITNKEEGILLSDPAYLKKLSDGLYNGIGAFIRAYEEDK